MKSNAHYSRDIAIPAILLFTRGSILAKTDT